MNSEDVTTVISSLKHFKEGIAMKENQITEARYLSDDRDEESPKELLIEPGGNGDWYVGVVEKGAGGVGRSIRICTSGGASTKVPGLGQAIATAFRILIGDRVQEERAEPIEEALRNVTEVRYRTDDRDGMFKDNELVIVRGRNGDWSLAIVSAGKKLFADSVRISTSGGASAAFPGLSRAIAKAFWALARARYKGRIP